MKNTEPLRRFEWERDKEFARRVAAARERLRKMSETEREHGFGTPEDGDLDMHARTIITAFAMGWDHGQWANQFDVLFDAYAMLQDLELRLRRERSE